MATVRVVFRSGNSSVVAIPSYMLEELGLSLGDSVTLEKVANKEIILRKLSAPNVGSIIHKRIKTGGPPNPNLN